MIFDTHTHAIAPDQRAYPLRPGDFGSDWYRTAPHSAEQLVERMDHAGVERAVLVQAVGAYGHDSRYVADSVAHHPDRLVGVCSVDPTLPGAPDELSYWIEERGLHGVRIFALSTGEDSWLDDPRTFPVWERAAKLGAHVIVTVLFHQLPRLHPVLERFAGLPVSLDHCGFPPLRGPPWSAAAPLLALSACPGLSLKISTNAIDLAAAHGGDPRDFVALLVAHFGASRLMWGSDFCQTHDRDYAGLVELGRHAFSGLDPADRALCLGGTASRLWPGARG